ncbi:M15 family metallopeptidase [Thermodesulfobacteriota bacterium B35]
MNRVHPVLAGLLVLAMACAACGRPSSPAPPADQATAGPQEKSKPAETVLIGGREFTVPPQWQGQKIREPAATRSELAPLPRSLAKDGGLIYLRRDARDALEAMARQAAADNIHLLVDSGYRSSRYQKTIISRQLARGKSFADISRFVAPPGYSEHLTGTAVDFSPSNWRFASTPQYRWLAGHASAFGFTETYPKNGRRHPWEPWHWRFRPPAGSEGNHPPAHLPLDTGQ